MSYTRSFLTSQPNVFRAEHAAYKARLAVAGAYLVLLRGSAALAARGGRERVRCVVFVFGQGGRRGRWAANSCFMFPRRCSVGTIVSFLKAGVSRRSSRCPSAACPHGKPS